jgi:hypothetical protein
MVVSEDFYFSWHIPSGSPGQTYEKLRNFQFSCLNGIIPMAFSRPAK